MGGLVALDLPGGPHYLEALRRIWDRGDAVLPIDRRLPPAARDQLLHTLRPTSIVDADGERRLHGDEVAPGDALVMPTSGSTGVPKGVVHTHTSLAASAAATSSRLGVTADDRWLACLPLAHIGGFSVITKALFSGTTLVIHDGFRADLVEDAAREGATLVSLVATALRRIDPTLFRVIVLGGSRPPTDRPPNAVATYGMTETGSGIVYDGRPLDGVELRVDAADGEILVRGPMLLRCYRDGTTPIDRDGWLHTDDIGRLTSDGTLEVEGRRGDLIVTGGEKVWPDSVERVIATHPGVAEVAVAGAADDEWGDRVVAWVVPSDPTNPLTLDQLRGHVRELLPPSHVPKQLVLVESLPRTGLGKVQRSMLTV